MQLIPTTLGSRRDRIIYAEKEDAGGQGGGSNTWEAEQENQGFEDNLASIMRLCLKR